MLFSQTGPPPKRTFGVNEDADHIRHDNGDRHDRRCDKQDALHQWVIQCIDGIRKQASHAADGKSFSTTREPPIQVLTLMPTMVTKGWAMFFRI